MDRFAAEAERPESFHRDAGSPVRRVGNSKQAVLQADRRRVSIHCAQSRSRIDGCVCVQVRPPGRDELVSGKSREAPFERDSSFFGENKT